MLAKDVLVQLLRFGLLDIDYLQAMISDGSLTMWVGHTPVALLAFHVFSLSMTKKDLRLKSTVWICAMC